MEPNPFQAPTDQNLLTSLSQGVWREGTILVVADGTPLPPRCVRCNAETHDQRRVSALTMRRSSSWMWIGGMAMLGAAMLLTVAGSPLAPPLLRIGAVVSIVGGLAQWVGVRRLDVPSCAQHERRSIGGILSLLYAFLFPLTFPIWLFTHLGRSLPVRFLWLAFGVGAIVWAPITIGFMRSYRPLLARRSGRFIRISGAGEVYLSEWPGWPGEPERD